MSFPGAVFDRGDRLGRCRRHRRALAVPLLQRPREDVGLHSRHRAAARLLRGLERLAPHQHRVEPREHRSEVDVRIHDDPVVLAVGSGDVAVDAHRDGVDDAAGGRAQSIGYRVLGSGFRVPAPAGSSRETPSSFARASSASRDASWSSCGTHRRTAVAGPTNRLRARPNRAGGRRRR